jgi:hypothetical protein
MWLTLHSHYVGFNLSNCNVPYINFFSKFYSKALWKNFDLKLLEHFCPLSWMQPRGKVIFENISKVNAYDNTWYVSDVCRHELTWMPGHFHRKGNNYCTFMWPAIFTARSVIDGVNVFIFIRLLALTFVQTLMTVYSVHGFLAQCVQEPSMKMLWNASF